MADLSTTVLHEGADAAAAKGDFVTALVHAAEALRVTPLDHRARLKVALCLAMMGKTAPAVGAMKVVAETLLRRGFVLSAIGACRDAFTLQPGAPEVRELLARIHSRIHKLDTKTKARVPPPSAITNVKGDAPESFFKAPTPEAAIAEAERLATTDPDGGNAVSGEITPVPFFSDLSKDAFISLVERLGYHKVATGHVVVKQAAEGTSLFILLQGEVRVSKGDGIEEFELARLGPGALFGELALITNKPRAATVTTTMATELFEIDRKAVEEVSPAHPTITEEIVGFARRRLLTNLLSTSKIFAPFGEAQRLELLKAFVSRVIQKGSNVIDEGQPPQGLFLVLEGEFEVSKHDDAGDRVVLAYLRESDVFGEIGLINELPATATVTAAEKSVLLFLEKAKFRELTANHPKILEYLSGLSGERLEETNTAMSADGVILDADDLVII